MEEGLLKMRSCYGAVLYWSDSSDPSDSSDGGNCGGKMKSGGGIGPLRLDAAASFYEPLWVS